MHYAKIRNYDIANGEGVRTSLFVSGCTNHCPGCFNPEAQRFDYGALYSEETKHTICQMLHDPVISGLSLLGGDPLCQTSAGMWELIALCQFTHDLQKTVWLWTGFLWEDVYSSFSSLTELQGAYRVALLKNCDVVVDGLFQEYLADRALNWRGSANQRVIDVQKTIKAGQVVLYKGCE